MKVTRACSFLLVILFIASGCMSAHERRYNDLSRKYKRLDRYIPRQIKDDSISDISVIYAQGGLSISSSLENYRDVDGPFVLEGQGLRYTNGSRTDFYYAYLPPGRYHVTVWTGIIRYWECETTSGEWVVCDGPRIISERTETTPRLPGLDPRQRVWVERNVTRFVRDYGKLECEVTLKPGVEYKSGLIISGCRDAQDPGKGILPPAVRDRLGMQYVSGRDATEEEVAIARKTETGIVNLNPQ